MSDSRSDLLPGDPAPWFSCLSLAQARYDFGSAAGRHVLLLFAASLSDPGSEAAAAVLLRHRALFDDLRCSLFIVTADEDDLAQRRAGDDLPGVRVLRDFDGAASRALRPASVPSLLLLDPTLRVVRWFRAAEALLACATIAALPQPLAGMAQLQAPVALVPRVFEPAFCEQLIAFFNASTHAAQARASEWDIVDELLQLEIAARIRMRLLPEVRRVFRFDTTRMENFRVCCQGAGRDDGPQRARRENDTHPHRQFAVAINLNAEDCEGGDLRFPEFGLLAYRPPTGAACVFSCGLMQETTAVTRGTRYAFMPFLYDEAAARSLQP